MTERLNIRSLRFRSGSTEGAEALDVTTPSVTLLVGPNNSGKSSALKELESWAHGAEGPFSVIDHITLDLPDTVADVRSMMRVFESEPPSGHTREPNHTWYARPVIRSGESEYRTQVADQSWEQWFENRTDVGNFRALRSSFVRPFVLRLDGRTRFELMDDKPTGPLEAPPANHLWALFIDDAQREKVREFTEAAFGKHFVIDPTGMNSYRVRLSNRRPADQQEEQALDQRARSFHQAAPLVSSLGDGVKAATGLVSAVMSSSHRILLIDEPEAFLHPTLARRMGRTLSEAAQQRGASLVIATHSADVLMGCIQSTPQLRLVRLTYDGDSGTARSIDTAAVSALMNDPLLRSTSALRALFHRSVVVSEADSDRAFYEEINARMLQEGRGVEDSLFLNAQNWQTIVRIVSPLRQLGIPAAAVFDFDVLMSDEFATVWGLVNSPPAELARLQQERAQVKAYMDAVGKELCKRNGVAAFGGAEAHAINGFIANMEAFGVFFVPVGELEGWLQNLSVSRARKNRWITEMFEALGADPDDDSYVRPGADDVWDFVARIERWSGDPSRLGIPS